MAIAEAEITSGLRMTEDELMRLPDDGFRYELVDGMAERRPAASFLADVIVVNIIGQFMPHARGRGAMSVGNAGFRMANGNIRVPSASYTRKERIPGGRPSESFGAVAPDLCVEIISPSDERADMARKVREYFDGGAQIVWHIFPETQQVLVFTSPTETQTFEAEDTLDVGDLLPGFSCRVSDLFLME